MSEENKSHVGATERVLLNQEIERLKTQLDWCRDSARMAVVELDARAESAEQRVKELESKVRDMEPTYLWGAKVMNETVLPRVSQMRKVELPAEALSRWLREGDSLRARNAALLKAAEPIVSRAPVDASYPDNTEFGVRLGDWRALRAAVLAAQKEGGQ